MTTRPAPQALEPYLKLPPETSLILLTGTLGCTTNWLTARYIANALNHEERKPPVLLISWLRDLSFWKAEIRRTTNIDISRHPNFDFHDAFTKDFSLQEILNALSTIVSDKTILVLDTPSLLLATNHSTASELNTFLLNLRSKVHSTALVTPIDFPLTAPSSPLEIETANFITTQAHAARWVLSLRELDTGAARDVSGVLRVTRGGSFHGFDTDEEPATEGTEAGSEAELLYLVPRDGNVKVFHRGSEVS